MIYYFITKLDDKIITWGVAKKFLHRGEYEQFHDFPIWTYKETTESGSKKFEAVFKSSSNKKKFGDYMINLLICQLFLIAKKKWWLIETNMAKMNLLSWEIVKLKM